MADGKCRSCEAPIDWAETRKGKRIPLDLGEAPLYATGAQVVYDDEGRTRSVAGTPDGVRQIAEDFDWPVARVVNEIEHGDRFRVRFSHFATCPNSSKHRRSR